MPTSAAELHVLPEQRADVEHGPQEVAVARRLGEREVELDVRVGVVARARRRHLHPLRQRRQRAPSAPASLAPRPSRAAISTSMSSRASTSSSTSLRSRGAGPVAETAAGGPRRAATVRRRTCRGRPRLDQALADEHADRLANRADADRSRSPPARGGRAAGRPRSSSPAAIWRRSSAAIARGKVLAGRTLTPDDSRLCHCSEQCQRALTLTSAEFGSSRCPDGRTVPRWTTRSPHLVYSPHPAGVRSTLT